MNGPMLGQTSRSAVESYLRAKREKGQLTDEQIARLDAIGFKWEKRKKKTIEEKVIGDIIGDVIGWYGKRNV